MKTCAACKETKPLDAFPIDRARRDGLYPYCRGCHAIKQRNHLAVSPEALERKREMSRAWSKANRAHRTAYEAARRRANPEQWAAQERARHLRRQFQMTPEEWAKRLEQQDGRCALCRSDDPRTKSGWQVDHDHETWRIRGLVCFPCNTLLGWVEKGWTPPTGGQIAAYLREA